MHDLHNEMKDPGKSKRQRPVPGIFQHSPMNGEGLLNVEGSEELVVTVSWKGFSKEICKVVD